jgi:transcriptional antiterminator RfaH
LFRAVQFNNAFVERPADHGLTPRGILIGTEARNDMKDIGNCSVRADEVPISGVGPLGALNRQEDQDRSDVWPESEAWFCLRAHPKHEHIAAAQLRHEGGIEVFLPRIRFQRATRCGRAWVTEALFQNYLFAKFDLVGSLRRVQAARGVRGVVHFGSRWPTVPEPAIQELRAAMDDQGLRIVEDSLREGDLVEIAEGAMRGLQAVVSRVMPARQRAAVLLDFLGRQTTVELDRGQLIVAAEDHLRSARMSMAVLASRPGAAAA